MQLEKKEKGGSRKLKTPKLKDGKVSNFLFPLVTCMFLCLDPCRCTHLCVFRFGFVRRCLLFHAI